MFDTYSIQEWVNEANSDAELEFREAVHTILAAIGSTPDLKENMVIKGGILLAIRYKSRRFTRDIDFSTPRKLNEIPQEQVQEKLEAALLEMVEHLDYDLDCIIQSIRTSPRNKPEASFPNIEIKVGYAYKGTPKHRRLLAKNSPTIISIDYSLNEQTPYVENLKIGNDEGIFAYSLTDIIAEKFRAVLQQKDRNRQRRQDIYDLYFLIEENIDFDEEEKLNILSSLVIKSRSRGIEPTIDSIDDQEIYERAKAEYPTLRNEIQGELPDFDILYEKVSMFYKSLDWPRTEP